MTTQGTNDRPGPPRIIARRGSLTAALWLSCLMTLSVLLAGCQRASHQDDQAPEVQASLTVEPEPLQVGQAQLTVYLTGEGGAPIEDAIVHVKGDMAHAGMVPVRAEAEGGSDGAYQADFEWTMGGDWLVTVLVSLADGRVTSRQFEYSVAGEAMPAETQ